ncbi:MAG: DegT/DnrJ/EryC1/StrS aminotransferase [Candidatus Saganbacteria bacterium]|uniref:DegT/DnrJ/EryC1/StrS aminotransferase n=1 Tax=Candidatus Saganbacteria bacterium TaxID=2575572 RepID=A0A833P3N1_UNCSA|nr:MAG: DegT/DnrJ/EryC1/StrS aminotransferase [Candidatus Saganbacteria bacterium]
MAGEERKKTVFKKPVPITLPTLPDPRLMFKKYKKIVDSRMITNASTVKEFEEKAASYLKVKHAVALNSCTSGLMLIMKILNLNGEVILPSFTFHATAHAVVWNGLKPVFVDCDPKTYNIDPIQVEKAITPNTSAILGVHLFGNPANVEELEKIAKKYNLRLIFDAAHAFGSKRKKKNIGGFGDAESFSLSPTKLLTSGEGGIVATNNKELADKLKIARNYGDSGDYDCEFSGFNARMSEFNALMGVETLKMLEKNVQRRNNLVKSYKKSLSNIPGIEFQCVAPADRSTFKDFSIYIDENKFGMSRDKLHDALLAENITVKKYFYPPVHGQKAFKHLQTDGRSLANTVKITDRVISLPLYSHMEENIIGRICGVIGKMCLHRT